LKGSADYKLNYDPTDPRKNMWLNVCTPIVYNLCGTGMACCQQWDPANKNGQAALGTESSLTFSYGSQAGNNNANGLIVTFTGGTPVNGVARSMEIDFVCDESAGIGTPTYIIENTKTLRYYFKWTTAHACPTGGSNGGGGSPSKGGLSGGSVFLIIFFVGLVVYFAAGIAFKRIRMHSEGIEMIPNVEFWTSLPGLVRDGVFFIRNKITGKSGAAYSTVK
jgi:hypothetical protein